jgi:hypothetical protein
MKKWTVYCHIHVATGRRYVGVTSQSIERRWKKHIYAATRFSKGGRWHFPNAIRKYGPEAFSHQVLGVYPSLEEGNWFETFWILMFDSSDSEKGFNLSKGGGSQPHPIRRNPWNDPVYRASQLVRMDQMYANPRWRHDRRNQSTVLAQSPVFRSKSGEVPKAKWQDPEYRANCIASFARVGAERTRRALARTHCSRGHEFSPENTSFHSGVKTKICKACRREDQARCEARKRIR